jgi:hypothetical protein
MFVGGCSRTDTTARDQGTAPEPDAARTRETAQVRFVNAYPGAVDLYFGDTPIFSGVQHKGVTSYRQVQEDWAQFKLRPAGQPNAEPLATNIEMVGNGERFTVIALAEEGGKATLRAMQDDETPAADKAKVRIVHAAGVDNDVDVLVTGRKDPVFEGVDANSTTDYVEVDPKRTALEVRSDDGERSLLKVAPVDLRPGRLYTIAIVDGKQPGTLDSIQLTDRTDEAPESADRTR